MAISAVLALMLLCSVVFSILTGSGPALAAAVSEGADAGIRLTISLAGVICLWSGLSRVMEAAGANRALARLFRPLLRLLFPEASRNADTLGAISANFTANLLGLGNAATPLGIVAVKKLAVQAQNGIATDEMCRFIVLNTASIQLLPITVAAVRAAAGAAAPFDILPCVWVTSLCAVVAGEAAAFFFGRYGK
ncbi:MAG: spore maturation protein A [Ruminococcaceae bacterium]|nr:spore maturation protein A [Oscillospiraceae bacterium]